MNSSPQDPALGFEAAVERGDRQEDALGRLFNLLADLALVEPPEMVEPPEVESPETVEQSETVEPLEITVVQPLCDPSCDRSQVLDCLPTPEAPPTEAPPTEALPTEALSTEAPSMALTVAATVLAPDGRRNRLLPPPPPPGALQHSQSERPERRAIAPIDALTQLQNLLVGSEVTACRDLTIALEQKITSLEHHIYEPAALTELLLPYVAELLSRKIAESKEEMVQAVAPIIDQAIQSRGEQDQASMSAAIAPFIAEAIVQQTNHSPEAIANAIAPTIGKAMKEQIRLEQDAMVDALYPIIGSTIAKYMAEALQSINQQIETTFSPEGIRRKIRAKLQGVSEAELILKQAMPFTIQAIFLIHKASGLLIAEIQSVGNQSLESEMLAGMLTAIRSFANDCMAQAGRTSELDQIDYGGAKIILEVAGYCYLAVVLQGEPPRSFMVKLRQTLSLLVKEYGNQLETFDGDPESVPVAMTVSLEALRDHFVGDRPVQTNKPPLVLTGAVGLLALLSIPWGLYQYHQDIVRQAEAKTALALASTPALAVYRLDVAASRGTLILTGRLPNPVLRWRAEQVAQRAAPNWSLDNQILAVEVPPDPLLAAAEVKRVTTLFNQTHGTALTARYAEGRIWVEGSLRRTLAASTVTQAYAQIPGVRSVTNTVNSPPLQIPIRIYFKPASAIMEPVDNGYKIGQAIAFLQQYPHQNLHLIGHSDQLTDAGENEALALQRALAVRAALVNQGAALNRLQVFSGAELAPAKNKPLVWRHRYVEFVPVGNRD